MGVFVMSGTTSGGFLFTLRADEGQVVLTSEWYTARESCRNGMEAVRRYVMERTRYRKRVSDEGSYFFELTAGNGKVIGVSSLYSSRIKCELGIYMTICAAMNADVLTK